MTLLDRPTVAFHNHAGMERALGPPAAALTWLAWLTICPALGFPTLSSAAMINRAFFGKIPEAGHNPAFWVGWVVVIAGLAVAIAVYFLFEGTHVMPLDIRTGVIYGIVLWLVAGVAIMPLLGLIEPKLSSPANLDPMYPTVMMYSLGPGAAVAALIAWVLFGAILGATGTARPQAAATRAAVQAP